MKGLGSQTHLGSHEETMATLLIGETSLYEQYPFSNDVCSVIMSFLQATPIINSCRKVCRQWFISSHHVNLYFESCRLNTNQLQSLTIQSYAIQLISMDLSECLLGTVGAQLIASSETLRNLTLLNMNGNNIGVKGANHLSNSMYLCNLTELNLERNSITDISCIACSDNLVNLRTLNVIQNGILSIGKDVRILSRLETLLIGNNRIKKTTLQEIPFQNLTHLDIHAIGIGRFEQISQNLHYSKLKILNLDSNSIYDAEIQQLVSSDILKNVTDLSLYNNRISSLGCSFFMQMPNLIRLNLCYNHGIQEQDVKLLRSSLPEIEVLF